MNVRAKIMLFACGLLVSLGVIAKEIDVTSSFAGTITTPITAGMDITGTPWGPEPMIISEAQMRGSLGPANMSVISRFDTDGVPVADCNGTGEAGVPFVMEYAFSVSTYKDHSQLYVKFDTGWICGLPGTSGQSFYRGYVEGTIVGGTGRFAGATGTVTSDFYGHDLSGPLVAGEDHRPSYGSFYGTMEGNLILAE